MPLLLENYKPSGPTREQHTTEKSKNNIMENMYTDKNSSFRTDGNEHIDLLLCMMASSAILSAEFKSRITNLALWIITNHTNHVEEIRNKIEELRSEMGWLSIFDQKFINKICFLLDCGLNFKISQSKELK
jgi:hypothetical protein